MVGWIERALESRGRRQAEQQRERNQQVLEQQQQGFQS